MDAVYYELRVSGGELAALRDLAFELGALAVQEDRDTLILRDEIKENLELIAFGLREFCSRLGWEIKSDITERENRDWIGEYKKGVKPIAAGKFYARPSWEAKKDGYIDLLIEPALAFGSGHHESTNSCLQLISRHFSDSVATEKNALDVGCGSGILSIALAKLGFKTDACDTDSQAIEATLDNASKNGVELNRVFCGSIAQMDNSSVATKNKKSLDSKKYDLVVANIIADVILMLAIDLKNCVKNGGFLILSGILDRYEGRILEAFGELKMVEKMAQNEWMSFIFKKGN